MNEIFYFAFPWIITYMVKPDYYEQDVDVWIDQETGEYLGGVFFTY